MVGAQPRRLPPAVLRLVATDHACCIRRTACHQYLPAARPPLRPCLTKWPAAETKTDRDIAAALRTSISLVKFAEKAKLLARRSRAVVPNVSDVVVVRITRKIPTVRTWPVLVIDLAL